MKSVTTFDPSSSTSSVVSTKVHSQVKDEVSVDRQKSDTGVFRLCHSLSRDPRENILLIRVNTPEVGFWI